MSQIEETGNLRVTIEGAEGTDLQWICLVLRRQFRRKYGKVLVTAREEGPGIDFPGKSGACIHIPCTDIRWVTSSGHYVQVCAAQGSGTYHVPFHSICSQASDPCFLLCNRGVLLNMDHIRRMENHGFVMDDGTYFAGKTHGYKEAAKQYVDYLLRRSPDDRYE